MFADELVEVGALGDDVPAEDGRGKVIGQIELIADRFVGLPGEEGDLTFVVGLVVEETVADDALACDAFGFSDLEHRGFAGGLAVMPEEIVVVGDVDVADSHGARWGSGRGRSTAVGRRAARRARCRGGNCAD